MKKLLSKIKRSIFNEEGATIIIVALSFTFLTIIVALVVDIGIAYYKTAEIQNAADASALAAGQQLPVLENDTNAILSIKNKAIEYAQKNGIENLQASDIELTNLVNGYFSQLTVNIPVHMETKFARIIGIDSIDITRNAKVKITPVKKLAGVVPLAIEKAGLDYCLANNITTHLPLKLGATDGVLGSFGAIDIDGVKGGGANDYALWLAYGYTTQLASGEGMFPVEPGNMAGPTNNALTIRYNSCTHFPESGGCTVDHYDNKCPRVVKVPVIVYDADRKNVSICGFAAFIIEPLTDSGYIYGSFIRITTQGGSSDTVNVGDALDFGVYTIKLTD